MIWAAIPLPYRLAGTAVLALGLCAGGFWAGDAWRQGRVAMAEREAQALAAEKLRLVRRAADGAAMRHADRVQSLNTQLGAAHARIAKLSGRDCLDPGTVGMLNHIGGGAVRAAAGEPAPAPPTAASDSGHGQYRHSTDVDLANAIAVCRSGYAELASQINAILDIEDARHGPAQ